MVGSSGAPPHRHTPHTQSAAPHSRSAPQVILRRLFEKLGATYIKLGQFVASSPTLFPPEYVLEFQKCLDRTEPVPWPTIQRTIERELGGRTEDVFSSIDPTPLATASIAQVHSAGAPPLPRVLTLHLG